MDASMLNKTAFFGCGNTAGYFLDFCKIFDWHPDYLSDNNPNFWDEEIEGIQVVKPDNLMGFGVGKIFLTVVKTNEVRSGLKKIGFCDGQLIDASNLLDVYVLHELMSVICQQNKKIQVNEDKAVLMDLSCGMVLGGVENWTYQTAKCFSATGLKGVYLVPCIEPIGIIDDTFPIKKLGYESGSCFDVFIDSIDFLREKDTTTIIVNFPFEIMYAACVLRKYMNGNMRIIAVQHNDEELYYERYSLWRDAIDLCLVISSRIKVRLEEKGFPKEKIRLLRWYVDFPKRKRTYSKIKEPIHIGYAGRITYIQKRVDRIIEIAKRLQKKNISFLIELAGDGDYAETLRKMIFENKIDEHVKLVGVVDHDEIFSFWEKMDIYICCSEYEGHSISQTEAMGMGAVPVVMDVSGAEDDIDDGLNGYIVPQGDIDAMVQRISHLYEDRKLLVAMGNKAMSDIRKKCDPMAQEEFWREILNDV